MLEAFIDRNKEVDSRLSTALELLIKRIVKKAVNSPETMSIIAETLVYEPKPIAPNAAVAK